MTGRRGAGRRAGVPAALLAAVVLGTGAATGAAAEPRAVQVVPGDGQAALRVVSSEPAGYARATVTAGQASVRGGARVEGGVATIPIGDAAPGTYRVRVVLRGADPGWTARTFRVRVPAALCGRSARRAVQSSVCPRTSEDGVYVDSATEQTVRNKPAHPRCLESERSDEHICFDAFNLLLAWQAPASEGAPPLLGGDGSSMWLATDGEPVRGGWVDGDGRHWWGPDDGEWTNDRGREKGLRFGRRWLIEFTDDGRNENSGEVFLNASAGDVELGTIRNRMWNDGETTHDHNHGEWLYPRCDTASGAYPVFVTCGLNGTNHEPTILKDDRFRDEVGFAFYFQSFPVRVAVQNTLPHSRFVVTDVVAPESFVRSPRATTLRPGAGITVISAPESLAPPGVTTAAGDVASAPKVGERLLCAPGTWKGTPSFTYSWLQAGDVVAGPSSSAAFTPGAAQAGLPLSCRVRASNAGGSAEATSDPTGVVTATVAGRPLADARRPRSGAPAAAAAPVTTLWLAGFRAFDAKGAIVIRGRLESTEKPAQVAPWVGQEVTLVAALASSETAPREDKTEALKQRWSSCAIASSGASGEGAQCSVATPNPGGPGALNQISFSIRKA